MSLIKKISELFTANKTEPETTSSCTEVEYNGYIIKPMPISEDAGYRVNGVIEKAEQSHRFIRADVLMDETQCADEMVRKAKCMIDQQGDTIFGQPK